VRLPFSRCIVVFCKQMSHGTVLTFCAGNLLC
jgi:hypothetical protein